MKNFTDDGERYRTNDDVVIELSFRKHRYWWDFASFNYLIRLNLMILEGQMLITDVHESQFVIVLEYLIVHGFKKPIALVDWHFLLPYFKGSYL